MSPKLFGGLEAGVDDSTQKDCVTSGSAGTNLDGFRLGAGIQLPFVGKSYSKVEYRYSNYESDFSRHQVLVGVGLAF